jgi:hypothetical protein
LQSTSIGLERCTIFKQVEWASVFPSFGCNCGSLYEVDFVKYVEISNCKTREMTEDKLLEYERENGK